MVDAAPADANPPAARADRRRFSTQIDGMYEGDPAHQAMVRAYAVDQARRRRCARLGWAPRASEPATDAVLRDDADRRRSAGSAIPPSSPRRIAASPPTIRSVTAGPLRETILGVVAHNADAATWERLRRMARDERNPAGPGRSSTGLLGSASDPALAQRALDLALTDEPGATNSSRIVGARRRPAIPTSPSISRSRIASRSRPWSTPPRARASCPASPRGSSDPAMVDKLRRLCGALPDAAVARARPTARSPRSSDRLRVRRDAAARDHPLAGGVAGIGCSREPARCGGRAHQASATKSRMPPAIRATGAGSRPATKRERRAAAARRDDAGEADAQQALADDQAGRGAARPSACANSGFARRASPSGRRTSRCTEPMHDRQDRPPSADRCRCRRRAAAGAAASPGRASRRG